MVDQWTYHGDFMDTSWGYNEDMMGQFIGMNNGYTIGKTTLYSCSNCGIMGY